MTPSSRAASCAPAARRFTMKGTQWPGRERRAGQRRPWGIKDPRTIRRAPAMQGKMDCFGLTDPGRVRAENQDQFLIASLSRSMQVHATSLDLADQARLFGACEGPALTAA